MSQTKSLSTGKPENYKNMDQKSHVKPKLIELALFNNTLPEIASEASSETELSKTSKSTRNNSKNSSVSKSKSKRHQPYTKSKPKVANPKIRNEFTTFQQELNQNESLFRNDFASMVPLRSNTHTDHYGSMQSMQYFPPNSTIFVPSMPYQSCPQQYSQQYSQQFSQQQTSTAYSQVYFYPNPTQQFQNQGFTGGGGGGGCQQFANPQFIQASPFQNHFQANFQPQFQDSIQAHVFPVLEPGQQFQLPMVQLKTPISKTVNYQVPDSENRITEIFENQDFLNNEIISNDHFFNIKNDPDGPQFKYFKLKASKKKKFKKEATDEKVKLESNSPEIEQMADRIIYDDMMLDEQSEYPDQFQLPPTPMDEARQNCTDTSIEMYPRRKKWPSLLPESREPSLKRTRQSFTSMTKIELVDEFQNQQTQDSRLTMADFCRQREICVRTFRIWVKNYPELLKSKHDNRKKKRTVWKKNLESSAEDENVEENVDETMVEDGEIVDGNMELQRFEPPTMSIGRIEQTLPELNPKDIKLMPIV